MERVHSMFSNVFSTPAGQLVEKATSSSLTSEDWGLNMQVCDTINSYSDGARDAVKAIKKRLVSNKSFTQTSLTLSLLETCIKNCGRNFHILVTTREFCIESLMKVIHAKNNPSVLLQQKILGLIKQLAQTFGSNSSTSGAKQVYEEMREKGFDFPNTEPFDIVKSSFNSDSHSSSRSSTQSSRSNNTSHQHRASHSAAVVQNQSIEPTPQQTTKLHKDLSIVDGNVKVFSEMLTELNPLSCESSDYELLQELNRTCRAMQQRIVELIGQVANEQITVDLLRVNDDLNNVFLRYDRFERFKANHTAPKKSSDITPVSSNLAGISTETVSTSHSAHHTSLLPMDEPPPSYSDTEQPTPEVNDLIDLSTDTTTTTTIPPALPTPTDTFSLSKEYGDISLNDRNEAASNQASYPMLSEDLALFDKQPEEIEQLGSSEKEIEQWLAVEGSTLGLNTQSSSATKDNGVSDEFSAFLSERAMASTTVADSSQASTLQPTAQ